MSVIIITLTKVQGDPEIHFYGKNLSLSRYPSERYCHLPINYYYAPKIPFTLALNPLRLEFLGVRKKLALITFG